MNLMMASEDGTWNELFLRHDDEDAFFSHEDYENGLHDWPAWDIDGLDLLVRTLGRNSIVLRRVDFTPLVYRLVRFYSTEQDG